MNPEDPRADGHPPASCSMPPAVGAFRSAARAFAEAPQLRREPGGATTADILEVMAEARRKVHESFGVTLEPEVQVLGEVSWPAMATRAVTQANPRAGHSQSRRHGPQSSAAA